MKILNQHQGANDDLDKVRSKTKLLLFIFIGVSFVLSVIELTFAVFGGFPAESIAISILSVAIDGLILTAIHKQWKSVLRVFRIVIIVIIVLCVLSVFIWFIMLMDADIGKLAREQIVRDLITVIISSLLYSLFAYLIGKYLKQIDISEQFGYQS